jgi:uroporphyrin-III C-methyltransferase/precorrin-2 dehydrogenase/sirohydrochlorin ferrochelatase
MRYLPLHLSVKNANCLVVGGGDVALRKSELLLRAGARVIVVAPDILPELAQQVAQVHYKNFASDDLQAKRLVIAATDDEAINHQVFSAAKQQGVWVNVVDQPERCDFIFPAIIDRDPIILSISSGGDAPVLARLLRAKLEALIPPAYGVLAQLAGRWRERVKAQLPFAQRRRFWEGIFAGSVVSQVLSGQLQRAEDTLQQQLQVAASQAQASAASAGEMNLVAEMQLVGEVYLVGAGPGDPDLLTFRALRLMQQADVVIYDRLVSPAVLDLVRRDAQKIDAGKQRGEHVLPQPQINQLLVDLAKQGKRVCRLKGGDPFIFGRGGEEIEELSAAGIAFQVVPGITAASGCASYAGIPLTHRDYAQSVRFITGHLKNGQLDLPWAQLCVPHETLVFYMGLISLPLICQQLIAFGMSPQRPVAIVEQGTLPTQRVIVSDLSRLPEQLEALQLRSPCLLIIGEVVNLHHKLHWYRHAENV